MREIKFRGLRTDGKGWVYGYLLKEMYNSYIVEVVDQTRYAFSNISVLPESVGQYTGLKDKNGVEIYEGDAIISFKKQYEDTPTTNVVKYERGCWRLVAGTINDVPLYNYHESELEVIGNIHENIE